MPWTVLVLVALGLLAPATSNAAFSTPTNSSPITMSADGKLVWVVNPGSDNVAVINTATNRVIKKVKVGDEPQSVALDAQNRYPYVANTADGTVTIIRTSNASPNTFKAPAANDLGKTAPTPAGAEPWNIAASPDGRRIYGANSSQDTIRVIHATRRANRAGKLISPSLIGYINLRGSKC